MPDQPTIRLNKVLRELNISLDRAVEHLAQKGHDVEARPTTKISQEIYKVLLDEFANDKSKKDASAEIGEEKRKEKEAQRLKQEKLELEKQQREKERLEKQEVIRASANLNRPKALGKIDLNTTKPGAPKVSTSNEKKEEEKAVEKVSEKETTKPKEEASEKELVDKVTSKEDSSKTVEEKAEAKTQEDTLSDSKEETTTQEGDRTIATNYAKLSGPKKTGMVIDFDSFNIIQLIKGAAALKYGGDTSGGLIILSSSRKQLKDSLYGNSNLILESNGKGGKITSMLEKTYSNGFFVNGQFTAKRFGDFHAPRYLLSNTGLREADFSIKLGKDKIVSGWKFGYSSYAVETGILKGAHIGNVEDLFYALNSDEPRVIEDFSYQIGAPKQQGKHQKISFSYFNLFKNQSKFEWGYNFQVNDRKEFDVRRGGRTEIPAIDLVLKTHNIIGSLSGINIENWTFELGINGLLQDNFSDPNTGIKRLIPDYLKYEAGAYVLGNFQKSNFFIWEWGVRLDQIVIDAKKYYDLSVWSERNYSVVFSDFEMQKTGSQILTNPKLFFLNFSAQTGISSKIGDRFKINASYVLSQRAPNASELFSDGLHHSIAAIEYGSLSLQKEISHKLLFSISKEKGSIIWSFEPFISKVYDYIYIEPTRLEQNIRGAFPVREYNATDVFLTGIDFTSSLSINREFKFDLGASYTYAQDLQNKNPLILIPPLNSYQKLKYTPREGKWDFEIVHHLNACLLYTSPSPRD